MEIGFQKMKLRDRIQAVINEQQAIKDFAHKEIENGISKPIPGVTEICENPHIFTVRSSELHQDGTWQIGAGKWDLLEQKKAILDLVDNEPTEYAITELKNLCTKGKSDSRYFKGLAFHRHTLELLQKVLDDIL